MVENSASDLSRFALVSETRVEFISPKQVSPLSSPHTNKHGIKVLVVLSFECKKNIMTDKEKTIYLIVRPNKTKNRSKGITIRTQRKILVGLLLAKH